MAWLGALRGPERGYTRLVRAAGFLHCSLLLCSTMRWMVTLLPSAHSISRNASLIFSSRSVRSRQSKQIAHETPLAFFFGNIGTIKANAGGRCVLLNSASQSRHMHEIDARCINPIVCSIRASAMRAATTPSAAARNVSGSMGRVTTYNSYISLMTSSTFGSTFHRFIDSELSI